MVFVFMQDVALALVESIRRNIKQGGDGRGEHPTKAVDDGERTIDCRTDGIT